LEENIQPLKTHFDLSSVGFFSQICRKAAFSGWSSGEDLRQARSRINSELPNLTVLSTGTSNVRVRAETLSIVRSTAVFISSICRATATEAMPAVKIKAIRRTRSTPIPPLHQLAGGEDKGEGARRLPRIYELI
jgi:hypothetical protein